MHRTAWEQLFNENNLLLFRETVTPSPCSLLQLNVRPLCHQGLSRIQALIFQDFSAEKVRSWFFRIVTWSRFFVTAVWYNLGIPSSRFKMSGTIFLVILILGEFFLDSLNSRIVSISSPETSVEKEHTPATVWKDEDVKYWI